LIQVRSVQTRLNRDYGLKDIGQQIKGLRKQLRIDIVTDMVELVKVGGVKLTNSVVSNEIKN